MSNTLSNTEKLFDYSSEKGGFNKPAQLFNLTNPLSVTLKGAPTADNWKDGLILILLLNLRQNNEWLSKWKAEVDKNPTKSNQSYTNSDLTSVQQSLADNISFNTTSDNGYTISKPSLNNTRDVLKYLNSIGIKDYLGKSLIADNDYGYRTKSAIENALKDNTISLDIKNLLKQYQLNFANKYINPNVASSANTISTSNLSNNNVNSGQNHKITTKVSNLQPIKTFRHADASDLYYNFIALFERKPWAKRHIRNDGTIGYRIGDVIYYGNGRFMNRKTGEKGTYDIRNFYNSREKYGLDWYDKIKKEHTSSYQQGGTMNNQEQIQKAFMAFLIEDAALLGVEILSELDLQAYAEELGKEGLQAKYQQFMLKMQGGVKARLGAKLNYIKLIKNDCPDGYEKFYFKSGGLIKSECRVCNAKKAMQSGGEVKKNPVEKFKSERDQYKKDMLRYKNDKAAQDSIKANKYNDLEVQTSDKGSYKNGKWVPDRSKYKMLKSACGSKMKKKK